MRIQFDEKSSPALVAALYHFVPLSDLESLKARVFEQMNAHGICGTILLAPEGINGTVAGTENAMRSFLGWIKEQPQFTPIHWKESTYEQAPFSHRKVKIKEELISLGEHADPSQRVGTYVKPKEWNDLINRDDVILIEGRNSYEYNIGTFKGTVDLGADDFKDFPRLMREKLDPKKHKKLAMFCTGGIRCEKLSAYALEQGFEEVYHLEGGILQYLEDVPAEESTWEGECYVFDERVAVGHGVTPTESVGMCPSCGTPLNERDRSHPRYIPGHLCGYCK